ncbi:hypothetical protein [Streptomyces scabiei]|uniref:hypothetical protein n=1 Tax=Streptomyces scabiei TaxID=1930 RepID=UPI0029B12A24|nr:hypothetical protein [Streptomyces scabiei]MDX2802672.1 hypothetical protein [Streptomyces scabiei]MDX3277233.1 hypothetical protein [Streptomyces scabiei]
MPAYELDALLDKLSLEDKLELVRRVRVNSLTLRNGDRVAARRRLRGSSVDEGLEAEGEDCHVPYDVPGGTLGRVLLVRQYVTPFPYGVLFDNDVELNLTEGDIVGVAEQPSEQMRERDDALWHIPAGGMFTTYCSRWIDRVGRACPQFRHHPGPCGLRPR